MPDVDPCGGLQASSLKAPLLGGAASRNAADDGGQSTSSFASSESGHGQSGRLQECTLGAPPSEFSTGILESPKNAEADVARDRGGSLAVSLEVPRIGNNRMSVVSRRKSLTGETDLAVAVIRNMQKLLDRQEMFRQRKEAEGSCGRATPGTGRGSRVSRVSQISAEMVALIQNQLQMQGQSRRSSAADSASVRGAGDDPAADVGGQPTVNSQPEVQAPAESEVRLAEERQQLAEERNQLEEERKALAEERGALTEERGVFAEERRQLEEGRERLVEHGQVTKLQGEMEELRKELTAAKQQLEVQKEEASLRPALAAAQHAQRSEAAQAAVAEAAKEQANAQAEILRVQCRAAEADLARVRTELSDVVAHKKKVEEELQHFREQGSPAPMAGNLVQGGAALLTRHELACRSDKTQAVVAAEASTVKSPTHWFSCCSSVETQQPKPGGSSPRSRTSG